MATPSDPRRLPRLNTMAPARQEESVEDRLLSAIADVLHIPRDTIQLYDSFTDLGGDAGTANALSRTCMSAGMAVKTSDILRCQTIAELQTCVTPFQPLTPVTARLPLHDSDTPSRSPSEVFTPQRSNFSDDESCSSRSQHSVESRDANAVEEIEKLLNAAPQVSKVAVVRPKAGYFEEKLVVLLTFTGANLQVPASAPSNNQIAIIPQSQIHFAGSQLAALKKQVLEAALPSDALPSVWIIIQNMPLTADATKPDRRRLQTWAQNLNEDLYKQIMSLESQELLQEPASEMEVSIRQIVSRVLKVPEEQIGMNFSFGQLGGDDISALQLVAGCRAESILLKPEDVLQSSSLSHIAFLASWKGSTASRWNEESDDGFHLSPMQQLYFQTAMGSDIEKQRKADGSYRFNQSLLLRIRAGVSLEDVHAAVEAVVGHHSMLRSRFHLSPEGRWTQRILADTASSYGFGHNQVSTDDDLLAVVAQRQASINVEKGPLFAAEHFSTTDGQQMLYIVAHHLVVDLISWRVIIQDLDELLQHGSLFSERSMPFQRWVEIQHEEVANLAGQDLLPFSIHSANLEYWGLSDRLSNTYGDAVEVGFSLSEELTSILQTTCNQVFRTDSADIYLAALLLSFCQTFHDREAPVVWNQEHGRETWRQDIDIAETVGWFTSVCPISIGVESTDDFVQMLRRMKDTRRSIPRRGWSYFASKVFGGDIAYPHDWPLELIFTYNGSLQQLERENGVLEQLPIPGRTLASAASDIGSSVGRIAVFEVAAMIDQGAAKIKFLYNRNSLHQDRIAAWISNYEHLLLEAIGRLRYRTQELTLSDVPLLNTTYEGLAKLNTDRLVALKLSGTRDIESVYPVTATQQEILISQSLQLESCHNHAIHEFVFPTGEQADAGKICTAWQQTVAKHPALRTVFIDSVSEDGLFDQVVLRKCSPNMLFIDAAEGDDAIRALNNLPPLRSSGAEPRHRLTVCKSSRSTFVKLDISQALCDSASVQNLLADLRRAYLLSKASLPSLNLSYPEYLRHIQSTRLQKSLDFWREHLQETPPCYVPRLMHVQPEATSSNVQITHFDLDINAAHFDSFTKVGGISRGTILRLAWGLVLRAFTGSSRVCFGYRTSGRQHADLPANAIQHAVGAFECTIACAMDLWAYKSLAAVLRATEEQLELSLPHQNITISEVQHAIGLRGEERLFNSCLAFEDEVADLKSRFQTTRPQMELPRVMSYDTAAYDVALSTKFIGTERQLVVDICHRILTPIQAQNIANTFGRAIQAILGAPNGSIGGVDLFTDRDFAQIMQQSWEESDARASDAAALKGTEWCVHHLVLRKVREQPEAPAVCSWDGDLSYRQLAKLVSRLSHYLVDLGVRPGVPVPVVLDKTRYAVVALLAVLKAGGCFIPIDADDHAMVEATVRQLGPQLILTTDMRWKELNSMVEGMVVVNDALFSAILPSESPSPKVMPTDGACILFSPGTSKSKDARGIVFTHSSLSAAFLAQGDALKLSHASRVMQLSCFSVDTALVEVLATLIHGGCVCIPSAEERVQNFIGAVNRMGANWTYLTPVLARRIEPATVPTLKTVCFRTRRLDEDTYAPWTDRARVLLAYGAPDICPLGISVLEVHRPQDLTRIASPFLGKFWIVNPEDHRRLVPIGAIGELVIEGPTLAQKFIPGQPVLAHVQQDSAAEEMDGGMRSRYFKTGHRVRYMEDGMMEFVSSIKDDVAVEGKVIPVAEVEQQLRRCLGHGVDLVVEAVTTRDAVPLLAAFIELGPKLFDGAEDLSRLSSTTKERVYIARRLVETSLASSLPSFMVPSVFIPVKNMPITPTLKVNRRKLQRTVNWLTLEQLHSLSSVASPNEVRPVSIKPLPLTQVEERMRAVWARVLNVPEMSITGSHSFIKLGGDDILAARLVVACRSEGFSICITDVLANATLTELCRGITTTEEMFAVRANGELQTPISGQPPALLHYDERFLSQFVAPQLGVEVAAIKDFADASAVQIRSVETGMLNGHAGIKYLTFNFSGSLPAKRLEVACQNLCKVHPILRTAFIAHDRKVYQVAVRTFVPDFKRFLCPSWRLASLADKIVKKDQATPVSLGTPITKFTFLDAGKQSMLIVRISTAQYDAASLALMVQDLQKVYAGAETLPKRPTYFDFVRSAQMASMQGAQEHWANLLDGAKMTQVIAHTKPQLPVSSTRCIQREIPVTSLANLGIGFDTVLKASWAMVIAALSGSGDVVFGELVEGRHLRLANGQDVSGVAGPTENTIPVRVRFADSATTPLELLQCVHTQRITGIPFENLGFLQIVEKCTEWPYWTRFSTVVQHKHRDGIDASTETSFILGNATCKLSTMEPTYHDSCDIFVSSTQQRDDRVTLSLTFCENRVPVTFADEALNHLCRTVHMLTSMSMMHPLVPSANDFASTPRQIPLPLAEIEIPPTQVGHTVATEHRFAIQASISAAWSQCFLDPRTLGVPEAHTLDAAFFDLWGSLIPAAQIATNLNRELPKLGIPGLSGTGELDITMEDILENPTMQKQFELVARKMRDRSDPRRKGTVLSPLSPTAWGHSIRRLTSTVVRSKTTSERPITSGTPFPVELQGAHNVTPTTPLAVKPPSTAASGAPSVGPITEQADDRGSMESMTTGSSRSDAEEDDIVSPLSPTPLSARVLDGAHGGMKRKGSHLFGKKLTVSPM